MDITLKLNIPPHFFDSANANNDFESVSEKIAKEILSFALNIELKRGNPISHEPDYLNGENGFEVTFAISEQTIRMIRGRSELIHTPFNIADSLIDNIKNAASRKSKKEYSVLPNLFIITIEPLLEWCWECYVDTKIPSIWQKMSQKRNILFEELYEKYIETNIFENIYIFQPTPKGHFALYDLKNFKLDKDFIQIVGIDSDKKYALPTCEVTSINGQEFPLRYNMIIHSWREANNNGN